MEGASFVTDGDYGCARATEIMNSNSSNDFCWSTRLNYGENTGIYMGIASKYETLYTFGLIVDKDETAIIYEPKYGKIYKGGRTIQKGIMEAQNGDEVHFRFRPKLKQFSISFVSLIVYKL